MKQTKTLIAILSTVVFLAGCGGQQISKEEAEDIALSHAGLSKDQVTFVTSEKEQENGKAVYDVEFYTKDFQEFDYQIDAKTGDILSFDADAENKIPSTNNTTASSQDGNNGKETITEEQAKTKVLEKVPGATKENIREWKLDRENGRMEYEGKIIYNNIEYEFEINGETGEIISWDEESVLD